MNYETRIEPDTSLAGTYEGEISRPRRKGLFIFALVAIALLLLAAWYAFSSASSDAEGKAGKTAAAGGEAGGKQAPVVTVIVPGTQPVANMITATGSLAARRDMPIGAVGEGGMVTRVLVEAGQWVRAGQVLAVVDRQVQAQQAGQISAQIRVGEANARLAQNELDRARALAERGFISKADIDRKTAQRDAANAQLGVARAQLGENAARIRRLDIRAPSDGLILSRAVEPGQVVSGGAGVLFRIAQGGDLELKAQLSEVDLARIGVGYAASVTPVGTATSFDGRIWQMSPIIDPQSRQGIVRIALPYNAALRPGGFATARINVGMTQSVLLPQSAVQSDEKGSFVFIVNADNKTEKRIINIGSVSDSGVSIASGLSGMERVVMKAGAFLNHGESVKPELLGAKK